MFKFKKLFISFILVFLYCGHVMAAFVVDGKFDAAENYSLGFSIDFNVEGQSEPIKGGRIFFGNSDDGRHFMYFSMPTDFVDNTYGVNEIGWDDKLDKVKHKFTDLLGSDALGKGDPMVLTTNNGSVELQVDYLAQTKNKDKSISAYGSAGITDKDHSVYNDKNEGLIIENGGYTDDQLRNNIKVGTSLEYNVNNFASQADILNGTGIIKDSPKATINSEGNYVADNSAYNGWQWAVAYEFEFEASMFNDDDWLDENLVLQLVSLGESHVSPSKADFAGYGDITPICGGDTGIPCSSQPLPEPATMMLVSLGLLGFVPFRMRKHLI